MEREENGNNDRAPTLDTISFRSAHQTFAESDRVVGLKGWKDTVSEKGKAIVVSQGWPCWAFVLESRWWSIFSL